jgi:hypothetical protein
VSPEHFDFDGIAEGAGINEFGAFVMEGAAGDGNDIALVLVAHEEELGVFLADFAFRELEANAILIGLEEGGDGRGGFEGVARGAFVFGNGFEEVQDLGGGDGGSAPGKTPAAGVREIVGVFAEFSDAFDSGLFVLPAAEAGGKPVGKVWMLNGRAGKLGGEDFFDGGKGVEPGEDFGGGLAVFEAAIELFAEGFRQAGNFASE